MHKSTTTLVLTAGAPHVACAAYLPLGRMVGGEVLAVRTEPLAAAGSMLSMWFLQDDNTTSLHSILPRHQGVAWMTTVVSMCICTMEGMNNSTQCFCVYRGFYSL